MFRWPVTDVAQEDLEARLLHARVHWGNSEMFCHAVEAIFLNEGHRWLPLVGEEFSPVRSRRVISFECDLYRHKRAKLKGIMPN